MNDHQAIQGTWRIMSRSWQAVGEYPTHFAFAGNTEREIIPSIVNDGRMQSTFRLDESKNPKEMVVQREYKNRDGSSRGGHVCCYYYRLEADELLLCGGGPEFPERFTEDSGFMALRRDLEPVFERKPSGIPRLHDGLLGRFDWDDNLHCYEGSLESRWLICRIALQPNNGESISGPLCRARQVMSSVERYHDMTREFASRWLLDTKNLSWLSEGESSLTSQDFISRLELRLVAFSGNGKVTFEYDDQGLFWGHSIIVELDENDNCLDVNI